MGTSGRVLVLSGSAGQGHVKAGEAVTTALQERHPALAVEHWDALAHMPRWFASMYSSSYIRIVDRHPILWRWVYEQTDRNVSWMGHSLSMLGGRPLVRDVAAWRPDLVLCTHFLAPEILSPAIARGKLATRLEICVTDHDAHRNWWWPEVGHAYVASDVVAARFRLRYGMAPGALSVTGIPVRADFARPRDVAGTRARYGLDPERPTVLFFSGGFVAGPLLQAVAGVWSECPDLQVLAVCGRNERLRRRVERLDRPDGAVLHALGFVTDVPDLMAVADLVVSKSGGLSTSECMALGRPMIISGHIAGQEERNADAVMAAGAGIRALSPEEICWRVGRLLADGPAREAMAARAKAFGRPHAAAEIADEVAAKVAPAPGRRGPYFHGAR
jgi:processive 1,2-diacylglycerol beta-glucosyltransferase